MSMTREEATELLRYRRNLISSVDMDWCANETEALDLALSALRTPTREQVEKMRGEWIIEDAGDGDRRKKCSLCNQPISGWWGRDMFCANCGAPMTDEAVEITMKRLEELKDGSTTD